MTPVASKRAQAIQAYIRETPSSKIEKTFPMEFGGTIKLEPVYLLPIKLLSYNLNNGRYKVELGQLQADVGYELDPIKSEDHEKLRKLLLGMDPDQTQTLKQDIQERGQIWPGVITDNGSVINANRRMAILESLDAEHPGGQYEKLKVQILPEGTGDQDLWRLEAGLQLSRDTRAVYSAINELLKLREGRNAKLTDEQIAAAMYGRKPKWVADSLKRLDMMDAYLSYFHWEGQYQRLTEASEQFVEVQRNMNALEKDGIPNDERYELLIIQFQAVRAGVGNWDLRDLKKIAHDDAASELLIDEIARKSTPGSALPQKDVKEAFESAQTIVEAKEKADRPGVLLLDALSALENIDIKSKHLLKGKNKYHFNKLRKEIKRLESAFA